MTTKVRKSLSERMQDYEAQIKQLDPSIQEIEAYADFKEMKNEANGVVTYGNSNFFPPHLSDHHTSGFHSRHYHIDLGFKTDIHLMLDKSTAPEFIDFVKEMRVKDYSEIHQTRIQQTND